MSARVPAPLLAAASLVALAGTALVIIAIATDYGPSAPWSPPPQVVAAPPPPAPPPPLDVDALRAEIAARKAAPPPPPVVYGPPRIEAPAGSWEAVPAASRAGEIAGVGPAVGRELNELHDKVAACFDDEVQARYGGQRVTSVKGFASLESTGTPVLMLQLETAHDGVRIVDAPVEIRGEVQDGLLACAQQVLRGRVLAAPGARPGARHRLIYPLIP